MLDSRKQCALMVRAYEKEHAMRFDAMMWTRPDLLFHSPIPSWSQLRLVADKPTVHARSPDHAYLVHRAHMPAAMEAPHRVYWSCGADFPPGMALEEYWAARFKEGGLQQRFSPTNVILPSVLTRRWAEESRTESGRAACARVVCRSNAPARYGNPSELCVIGGAKNMGRVCRLLDRGVKFP